MSKISNFVDAVVMSAESSRTSANAGTLLRTSGILAKAARDPMKTGSDRAIAAGLACLYGIIGAANAVLAEKEKKSARDAWRKVF